MEIDLEATNYEGKQLKLLGEDPFVERGPLVLRILSFIPRRKGGHES